MGADPPRLRESAFLMAAVALPLVVVLLFLVAAAVPRWLVRPPTADLLLRADRTHTPSAAQVVVTFRVRNGQLQADVLPAPPNTYPPQPALLLVDHRTGEVREIPFSLPAPPPSGSPARTIVVDTLEDERIVEGVRAPDGYVFEHRYDRGPGLIGEIFGMRRDGARVALVKDGRVVPVDVPPPYSYGIEPLGWIDSRETP